jgi:rubrerythrin
MSEYIKKEDTIKYLNDLFGEMYHVSLGNVLQSLDSLQTYSFPDSAENKGDLISRQAVENITWEEPSYSDPLNVLTEVREKVRALPSVENKGEWIAQDIHNCHTDFKCSKCGYIHSFMHLYGKPTADYTYCPNCGAKMEGVET